MNEKLIAPLTNFLSRAKATGDEGEIISHEELKELNSKLGQILPDWFIEILTKYPIAGAQIEYPFYDAENEDDGYLSIRFVRPEDILNETTECYPGLAIKDLGYFCIGLDLTGSGDQFFTTKNQGDDPPIYVVYHDVSDIGNEIEKHGMKIVAASLTQFFSKAKTPT